MIKAISYWSIPGGLENTRPIGEALDEAKAAGFAGLEIAIGPDGALNTGTTRAECEEIRSTIEESGMVVQTMASGMTWGVNPTSEDPAVRKRAVELGKAALERAAWTGCQAMLMVPGVVNSPISPAERIRYDTAVERCRDAVKALLDTAERVGVDLCLENVWNGLFLTPDTWISFLDSFNSGRLGMYFDCGNLLRYHQHPPHWIQMLGSRIKRVHIKDFREAFNWDGTYSFCELGEGDVPWKETFAALREIGYDKTIVAEMLPPKPGLLERTSAAMDRLM